MRQWPSVEGIQSNQISIIFSHCARHRCRAVPCRTLNCLYNYSPQLPTPPAAPSICKMKLSTMLEHPPAPPLLPPQHAQQPLPPTNPAAPHLSPVTALHAMPDLRTTMYSSQFQPPPQPLSLPQHVYHDAQSQPPVYIAQPHYNHPLDQTHIPSQPPPPPPHHFQQSLHVYQQQQTSSHFHIPSISSAQLLPHSSVLSRPNYALPLPSAKSVLEESEAPTSFVSHIANTVSPISTVQTADSTPIMPLPTLTTQRPPEMFASTTALPTLPSLTEARPQTLDSNDSLISRLRGFSGPAATAPPVGTSPVSAPKREPIVREAQDSYTGATGAYGISKQETIATVITTRKNAVAVPTADRPHACTKCPATFGRRDNLMAHNRAQHKGERPFKCEVCSFRFIKKDHAVKHWKVVHLKERPFVCNRCNSRFGQRSDLNKHVKSVHLRIKPFECVHCGLRFSHRGNQIRHQAVVHEKRKPYTCVECNSSFAEKSNLLKHCQAVHKSGTSAAIMPRT